MVSAFQDAHALLMGGIGSVILRMHWGDGMGGGMGWMMWLIMILFWLLILVALAGGVYWLFSRLFGTNSSNSSKSEPGAGNPSEALSVLNERYARGEIDDEEYSRRKKNIKDEK